MNKPNIPAELFHLIPDFLLRREREVEELKKFLELKDYQGIGFIAHRLKGIGSSYGFDDISQMGEYLQIACDDKNDKELRELINHLGTRITTLTKEIVPALAS